jgi:hypothetical protein
LKIVNAPYFDGDTVSDIASFFSCFCGIDVEEHNNVGSLNIGVSELFGKPFLDFKQGTNTWEAMQQASKAGSFRVVLQPNGKCYFIKENKSTGLPVPVNSATGVTLSHLNVISFSI